jgi:predicted dehydrogenase
MHRVKIVGAGQLGSRHLQALQSIETPLEIHVIDPSVPSLEIAKERFETVKKHELHQAVFTQKFEKTGPTDVSIVATNADTRRAAVESLLEMSDVNYLVLEKLLFVERADYVAVDEMLAQRNTSAWVNCPMRVMPPYEKIRAVLQGKPLSYRVTGSRFGMVTNAIHYIDHMAHLTGCLSYKLDLHGLHNQPVPSKRAGFLELNGTLVANFEDGSRCEITCYPNGNAPVIVEIFNENDRFIVRESEGMLWHSGTQTNWIWTEDAAPIPYQSQITSDVVSSLLMEGSCRLTPYKTSSLIHLSMLDPLLEFVRTKAAHTSAYPFT